MSEEIETERQSARKRRRPPNKLNPAGALAAPVRKELPEPTETDIKRAQKAVYFERIFSHGRAVVVLPVETDENWRFLEKLLLSDSASAVEVWVETDELALRLFPTDEVTPLELLVAKFRAARPRRPRKDYIIDAYADAAMPLAEADFAPPPEPPLTPVAVLPPSEEPTTTWMVVTFPDPPDKVRAVEIAQPEDWYYLEHDCEQSMGGMEVWYVTPTVANRVFPADTPEAARTLFEQFERMNPGRRSVNDPPLFEETPVPEYHPDAVHPEGPVTRDPDQDELFAPEYHPGYTVAQAKTDQDAVWAQRKGAVCCEDVT